MRILAKSVFCIVILLFPIFAQSTSSNELTTFVNNAIKQLNESTLKIPSFEKTEVDTVQGINVANRKELYLCWLKNDKGRVGYIAVAENSGSFNVVAFSATTTPPDYFLKNLKIDKVPNKQLNLSTTKQVSFVENVPLVAATKTLVGTDAIEISEISASLSSLLNYLQNKRDITFFGHIGSAMDSEYTRRFKADPNSGKEPNNKSWKSYEDEVEEVKQRENIPKLRNTLTNEQVLIYKIQTYRAIKPIIRRRLLNPVNAGERIVVIRSETNLIDSITKTNLSSGMKDAILLQLDYLNGNISNLQEDIDVLFKTRGRKVQIEIMAFKQLKVEFLPAILLGPENNTGALLGYLDIDGEIYASVFFPRTTKPNTMSLTQKLRENRIANNQPAELDWEADQGYQDALKKAKEAEEKLRQAYLERGLPDPTPEKSIEERIRESMQRTKDLHDKMILGEDIYSENPKSLENGVHLIKCSSLSSWQVLSISNIQVGDNW